MGNPENNISIPNNKEPSKPSDQTYTTEGLLENLNEKEMLRKLLEEYFHMIDILENLDFLEKNVGIYENALKNLLAFFKTPFMKKTFGEYLIMENFKNIVEHI